MRVDAAPERARPNAHRSSIHDVLFLPLLSAHGLVRDGINDVTVLRAFVEHSEVLTQDHKGRTTVHAWPHARQRDCGWPRAGWPSMA